MIEIERGDAIQGRIVTPEGEPFRGVSVEVNGTTPADAVSTSGISSITDESGEFFLPGIRFGNTPNDVFAAYDRSKLCDDRATLRGVAGNMKRVLNADDYDESTRTWEVGDIVLEVQEPYAHSTGLPPPPAKEE